MFGRESVGKSRTHALRLFGSPGSLALEMLGAMTLKFRFRQRERQETLGFKVPTLGLELLFLSLLIRLIRGLRLGPAISPAPE
jgi:hypothetical protein